ncbi:CRISPR-associated endonuclease Cas2 [Thermovirga lienii]|jgi:CRISPR-associated protein Cas2|uniref:CRISPR-associated endonuclease Cas2 n=1 Tax=Thermovirga lienii TaxID=336261 RepID=UPI00265367D4|nr:CRISPR-associated protein Cas2 [Thermovirga sp.]MDN5368612.1 CRISPR-associated protein Cas2 [Thermovirga sp.]
MFRVLVYDVSQKKVYKVRKYLSDKMFWVQNSTFEGHLRDEQKLVVMDKLKELLDPREDSLLLFSTEAEFAWEKMIIGLDKSCMSYLLHCGGEEDG